MSCLRLGLVSYTNLYPATIALERGEVIPDAEVVYAHPSTLNAMLRDGELDLALISAAEYLHNKKHYTLLPSLCVAAPEEAESVALFTNKPVHELGGGTIGLTGQSSTSVALLKLLCSHLWNVEPHFEVLPKDGDIDSCDACLLIGDDCLRFQSETHHKVDLVTAWRELTATTFCFAVLAARRGGEPTDLGALISIEAALMDALDWGEAHADTVIEQAQKKVPLSKDALETYYRHLHYRYTPSIAHGLATFEQLLAAPVGFAEPMVGG